MASTTQGVRDTVGWTSGFNLGTGIWLIVAPFILGYSSIRPALWNDVVVGILVALLAANRIRGPLQHPGYSWTNAGIGVWLVIAPFVLPYRTVVAAVDTATVDALIVNAARGARWNDIIVGVILIILGAWSAMATQRTRSTTDPVSVPRNR